MKKAILRLLSALCGLVALPAAAITCRPAFPEPCHRLIAAGKPKLICTCVGIPKSGVLIPSFYVTHVVYAPPGNLSTVTYTGGNTFGSATSTTSSYKSGDKVNFKGSVSFIAGADFDVTLDK